MAPKKPAAKSKTDSKTNAPVAEGTGATTRKRKVEAASDLEAQIPDAAVSPKKGPRSSGKKADVAETRAVEDKPAPSSKGKKLKEGDSLPSFKLLREDDVKVDVQELAKDQGVVIFLYPRANTGGCTKQALGFKENHKTLQDAGFEVYGLSFDKPKSQTTWKTKYDLPYHLLTDESGEFIKALGAFKPPRNVIRSHVVVAKGGKIVSSHIQISPGDSFAKAVATVADVAKPA
ncbi:Peroxiredoxin [Auxenochlorella protothecoides]|uniref:thioredoxin-dependent peroxiredoxin n=1 Tax=Auxenochlorella protothecoides TaxID=3075 RepID=A0A087SN75_AUXPR|nr:Peroxiredoxin [Auxenochlorella protothecoides]KFM27179.1 Peroxiredoxin [Auxenochlorella protothecoides]RMZ57120.1 hypothetical protein APUTEX25_002352 [Auxenochlorella protothecoides]|eukprot:RMZ57120.1 hypothetical protein APUTEX25_002352 [Auxenochlorella protothecoides]